MNSLKKYFRTNIIAVVIASLFSISVVSQAAADGITWTSRTPAENNQWASVAYGDGLWVAVSIGGDNRVMTSAGVIVTTAAANAEAARVAAANAEAARKAKEQRELTEILALIPSIGDLTLSLGEITKSLY